MENIEDYKKAGEIAKQVIAYAKKIIKKDVLLIEIAQKIDLKIRELGGKPAFPVNLSIDDVAAHYHPFVGDESVASGLLKIDIGVHVNGYIADTAFSIDLSEDGKYEQMIKVNQKALDNALKLLEKNPSLNDIGGEIQKTIEDNGFLAIVNLSGHGLSQYEVHSGITIPNYANNNKNKLDFGAYAVEPFVTTGEGKIYEGGSSNIYALINPKNTRNSTARDILDYVMDEYKSLPFSLREMQEKFGAMARLAIKQMVQEGILHEFPQLIEKSHKPVSQAEHTFVKKDNEIIITTK